MPLGKIVPRPPSMRKQNIETSDDKLMRLTEIYYETFRKAAASRFKVDSSDVMTTNWIELYMFFPEEVACHFDAIKAVIAEYELPTAPDDEPQVSA